MRTHMHKKDEKSNSAATKTIAQVVRIYYSLFLKLYNLYKYSISIFYIRNINVILSEKIKNHP